MRLEYTRRPVHIDTRTRKTPAHQMNWCTSTLAASGITVVVNFSSSLTGAVSTAAAVIYSRIVCRCRDASLEEGPTVCHLGGRGGPTAQMTVLFVQTCPLPLSASARTRVSSRSQGGTTGCCALLGSCISSRGGGGGLTGIHPLCPKQIRSRSKSGVTVVGCACLPMCPAFACDDAREK